MSPGSHDAPCYHQKQFTVSSPYDQDPECAVRDRVVTTEARQLNLASRKGLRYAVGCFALLGPASQLPNKYTRRLTIIYKCLGLAWFVSGQLFLT